MRRMLAVATIMVVAALGIAITATGPSHADSGRVLKLSSAEADESFICFFEGMEPVLYETVPTILDGFGRIITDAEGNWVRGVGRAVYDSVEYRLGEGQPSGAPDPVFVTGVQITNVTFNEQGGLSHAILVVPKWELRDADGQLVDSGRSVAQADETGTIRANYTGACTDYGTGRVEDYYGEDG